MPKVLCLVLLVFLSLELNAQLVLPPPSGGATIPKTTAILRGDDTVLERRLRRRPIRALSISTGERTTTWSILSDSRTKSL